MRKHPLLGGFAALTLIVLGCDRPRTDRQVLRGTSPLIAEMNAAAAEFDVPSEILAGIGWAETALIDRTAHWGDLAPEGAHAPRAAGVMGIPEVGRVRSIPRAAALAGVAPEQIVQDRRHNIRGAAALLRDLADAHVGRGLLGAAGDRDEWLRVVGLYFDAGAAGDDLALEVRKTIARGVETTDDHGERFEIVSYAELYDRARDRVGRQAHALNGEYPGSTWVGASSSNFTAGNRRGADINLVVIHTTQGSYAGAISWFQNPAAQASAHYVIRASDGAVTQTVHHADIAWHAGNWSYNVRSVGIEHEGWVTDPNAYTTAMYQSSANLTRWLCNTYGIPKDRSHIIGHVEVPNQSHTDPGGYWNWTRYMQLVTMSSPPPPPPPNTGTLKGVVYIGTTSSNRISGANVTVTPGGTALTADGNGYFQAALAPGNYTITARANGYTPSSVTRMISAGADTWGSVGLTRMMVPTTGGFQGVVYDARSGDMSARLAGVTVRLSNGSSVMTNALGEFAFTVAPGAYTATAELSGWMTNSVMRTVVANESVRGSIALAPNGTQVNLPPGIPAPQSPVSGVEVISTLPVFTVEGLTDPENDPLTLEAEIYTDPALAASSKVSTVKVAVPGRATLVSWRHPGNDLPRKTVLYWRARATEATGASPWSTTFSFLSADDLKAADRSSEAWIAQPLPGVGTNRPPTEAMVKDPAESAIIPTTRPLISAGGATDPDGDALSYQFAIGADDLFQVIEATSPLVPSQGDLTDWVASKSLAPGGAYYVRVRAADQRVFGPWSEVVAFFISPNAATSNEERPGDSSQRGMMPTISAKIPEPKSSGCTTAGGAEGTLPLVVALGAMLLIRMRARSDGR